MAIRFCYQLVNPTIPSTSPARSLNSSFLNLTHRRSCRSTFRRSGRSLASRFPGGRPASAPSGPRRTRSSLCAPTAGETAQELSDLLRGVHSGRKRGTKYEQKCYLVAIFATNSSWWSKIATSLPSSTLENGFLLMFGNLFATTMKLPPLSIITSGAVATAKSMAPKFHSEEKVVWVIFPPGKI